MRLRTIVAFLILLAPVAAGAANSAGRIQPTVPPAIVKLANAVVRASNADDASALTKLYAEDAVVVDEIPPFVWRGAGAGVAWWQAVDSFTMKKHERIELVNVRVSEFQRSAIDAYLIQPMTILEFAGDKRSNESGTWTYTFRNSGGTWLISSQVWTTKP